MLKKVSLLSIILIAPVIFLMVERSPGAAQTSNRAGLVVDFGDGRIETTCITFDGETITGYDLLQRSGFSITASFETQGAAICKIDDQGCPANDCFCQSPPDYWSYWHQEGGEWTYSSQGSSSYSVEDGHVDGWAWGPAQPPPLIPFDQVCAEPTVTSTPTRTSTHIPDATATDTPLPSPTPTSTTRAYPPPLRETNTQTASTVHPTNTPHTAAATPTHTQNQAATIPAVQTTPLNPRMVFPAIKSTLPALDPLATPVTTPTVKDPAPTSPAVDPIENVSGATSKTEFPIPLNYLLFGFLAVSLFFVTIFQSVKRRQ